MRAAPFGRNSLGKRLHQWPRRIDQIDLVSLDILGDGGVERPRLRPQFEHVAEHGDSPLAVGRAQEVERGAHRGGIGVVALVDDREGPVGGLKRLALAASGRRPETRERARRRLKVEARRARGHQNRQRIHGDVSARRADRIGQVLAEHARLHPRRLAVDIAGKKRGVGLRALAEGQDEAHASRAGGIAQSLELRVVAIENGDATALQSTENLGLGVGDRLDRSEMFEMDGRDPRDDRDMRLRHCNQRRDLAGMVHADFEHAEARAFRHARQRQRYAPVIVVGGG